jgi:hypothetical protein
MPKKPKQPSPNKRQVRAKAEKAPPSPASKRRFPRPSFRRRPKPAKPPKKLTGSFRLFSDSVSLLRQHWKLFGGIVLVYFVLSLLLGGGLGGANISELKNSFSEEFGSTNTSLALLGILVGSTGGSASAGSSSAFRTIIVILVSLAVIWALRQVLAGKRIGIRDAFYKGMYPLAPFVIVIMLLGVLLIPMLIGSFIFGVAFGGGLMTSTVEVIVGAVVVFLFVLATVFLLSTYVFAIYVVTLPDMRPVAALRAARKLALYHRWAIIRKLLFLPVALGVIGGIVLLPVIAFIPAAAQVVFLLFSMLALVFAHTYAYSLYKELL